MKRCNTDTAAMSRSIQSSKLSETPLMNTLYVAGVNLKCAECDTLFYFQEHFINHMAIDHDVSHPYRCSECDKHFKRKSNLLSHRRRNHIDGHHTENQNGEKRFQCTQCTSSFSAKGSLKRISVAFMTKR